MSSSLSVTNKLKRAETEIKAGRSWRAKEVFQGSLSDPKYVLDPAFLEAYGKLLDSLGDRFEAGKYLFLSGQRQPSYCEPIELFWYRVRKASIKSVLTLFPRTIHQYGFGHLPQIVKDELRERGADSDELNRCDPLIPAVHDSPNATLIFAGIISLLLAIIFCSIVGAVTILDWFF